MPLLILPLPFVDEKNRTVRKRGLNGKVAPSEHIESKGGQNGRCLKWCNDRYAEFVSFYNTPRTKFIIAMVIY